VRRTAAGVARAHPGRPPGASLHRARWQMPTRRADRDTVVCGSLALLWLMDAGLQLQPLMFTRLFPATILYANALMYQPQMVAHLLVPLAAWLSPHLLALNWGVATLQALIALGLWVRRTRRAALAVSAGWALCVWVVAEGLGGMATGTALLEFGAPGAALLYAAVSGLLWRSAGGSAPAPDGAEPAGAHPAAAARVVWSCLWGLGAALHLPLVHPAAGVLAYNLQSAAQDQPGALATVDYGLARFAYAHATSLSVGLALIELAIAAAVWSRRWRGTGLAVGTAASLAFWVIGQAMGGVFTGLSTDPQSAPLVVLLAVLALGSGRPRARPSARG